MFKSWSKRLKYAPTPLVGDEVLRAQGLKCVFDEKTPEEFWALNGIDFTFEKNKIYCIIGNSGSGKSTLVTHFNGLLTSKYGTLSIRDFKNNHDIVISPNTKKIKNFKRLRKIISMVFQFPEYQLFKDTIQKDIMFGPVALGVHKEEAAKLAKFYLNRMGLDSSYLDVSPFELSGGQKRRVAIAGILAIQSEIIIFDEPTAGLDPKGESEMVELILESKKENKTVIVITHQMEKVLEIADEVILLDKGKILTSGTPYQIFTDPEIIQTTSIALPHVVQVINDLSLRNPIFKKLYDYEPRTVKDLAKAINEVIKNYEKRN
ncbi:ABC-type cobalt transport ATP-binding protein [Mycoplasmoides gallisepticum str. F]|uniref:ATP-binding cassette domain-containing protein n=1 Tax=Mycoplasmoides gallisepticum TaxID=2096 RepID=UPI0001C39A13|nr:ATP-binding cassette domain-containing protein [Mycoplasmoides gallisepticum]ADC31161.1 ABC-type cobalt transport ATP-binding protein [Mycoplasmoides gallisepticum str. F]